MNDWCFQGVALLGKNIYYFYLITQSSYQHSWRGVGKRYGSQRQDSGTDRSAPYRQERTDQETQSDEHFPVPSPPTRDLIYWNQRTSWFSHVAGDAAEVHKK